MTSLLQQYARAGSAEREAEILIATERVGGRAVYVAEIRPGSGNRGPLR